MGGESMKLPLIDFSNLKQETTDPSLMESVKSQVFKALEEYGCFEARFDQLPLHLQNSVFDGLQQLCDLPLQTKLLNKSNIPYHGYFAKNPFLPLYESFGIGNALSPGEVEAFTNLMWSDEQGKPAFSKSVETFYGQLSEFDKMVRRMVVESLGLDKYVDEHLDSTEYLIRLQKYDCPDETHDESSEAKLGLLPHTDKNMLTILSQNEVSGLQVETKAGDWFTVHPSPGSFIVMIGETFHAWTNGRVHCANHRVVMSGDEARYSVGLFSYAKPGYIVKAPEEIVDEEHPLLFKPFDYLEFLNFHRSEAGRTSGSYPLKAYCGV